MPAAELVHVPLGMHHERYPLRRPIAGRPRRIAFCFNRHPSKGAPIAIAALDALRDLEPDVEVVAFGSADRRDDLPDWIDYRKQPSPEELVDDVYNGSAIELCPRRREGFGWTSIEAMSGGAALVTTDNGGSDDRSEESATWCTASTTA